MPCTVLSTVSSTEIFTYEKFIGAPPKEVLYLYISITKMYFAVNLKNGFCRSAIEIRMRIENVTIPLRRQKYAELIYASLTNYALLAHHRFFNELKLY